MTPESITQFARTCVNFNGYDCKVCLAGVEYDSVKAKGFMAMFNPEPRYPCQGLHHASSCPQFQRPSTDQVRHKVRMMEGEVVARRLIKRDVGGLMGVAGSVSCPVCNARLKYQVMPRTGLMRFKCETKDCLLVEDV